MFDWYDDGNDYEGALLRTESEPPAFGDEGQMEEENMRVKIDGNEYGILELNGREYMCLSDNDDFDSYLGDKEGNVYKANYDDYGRLVSAELIASLDSKNGEGSLLGLEAIELPREFLAGLPIRYVDFLGIAWDDCYPVCYDADRVVEDIYDANGSLLWDTGASTDNLVVDDSYEYVRPKTKKEKEEEHIGEYARPNAEEEEEEEEENVGFVTL